VRASGRRTLLLSFTIMNLFILNGTCGSGKSSVSQFLVDNHNFLCISCDKLIREEKNKNGIAPKYNSATIYTKYFDELLALPHNTNVIIDSIFTEADINHFIELLPSFSITLFHIILYPKYSIAYKRTQERTCFKAHRVVVWVNSPTRLAV
jgi:predicted ABC-type ATPase